MRRRNNKEGKEKESYDKGRGGVNVKGETKGERQKVKDEAADDVFIFFFSKSLSLFFYCLFYYFFIFFLPFALTCFVCCSSNVRFYFV